MALPGHGGARRATVLERCLYAAAALFLGYWLWVTGEGWWFQTSFAQRLAAMGVPTGTDQTIAKARRARHEARSSGLVGRITIPRVHVSAIVVEGTSNAPLRRGVGHVKGSAFPGERGNVVLAAHRDTYFRGLREIQRGDRVLVATPDGVFDYQVDTVMIVSPRRTYLIARTPSRVLTLVTCHPFDWVGPAPHRFIVRSSPVAGSERLAGAFQLR